MFQLATWSKDCFALVWCDWEMTVIFFYEASRVAGCGLRVLCFLFVFSLTFCSVRFLAEYIKPRRADQHVCAVSFA